MPRRPAFALAALAVACAAAQTAPARAGARPPAATVAVTSGANRLEIRRAPFALRVVDGSGRVVLRSTAPKGRTRLPATDDPEPFTLQRRPDRAYLAPLGFLVGSERAEQWRGSYFAGDVLRRTRSGIWQSARSVRAVRHTRAGLSVVLATTDPGRRMTLRVAPSAYGGFALSVRVSRPRGVVAIAQSFASPSSEHFHGLGGRHGATDLRGQTVPSWVEQENFGGERYTTATNLLASLLADGTTRTLQELGGIGTASTHALQGGTERAMFPGGPGAAYSVGTELVSSAGYGLTLDRTEYARWRLAVAGAHVWQLDVAATGLDSHIDVGDGRSVTAAQTARSGRHRLGPAWADGPTLWRLSRVDGSETPQTYMASIERDLADIARLHPPLTAYAFEGWAVLPTPFVERTIARLRARGIRTILYVRAYFAKDVLSTQSPALVDEVNAKRLMALDAQGRPFTFGVPGMKNGAVLLDFTNPAAVRLWDRELRRMLDLGADGFMEDFGESTQDGMRFHDGQTGRTMHNRYPVLYHRTTRRLLSRYEREHPGRGRIFMFSRAGFTGSARYENANFPGDEATNWSAASGLRSLTGDMLNRAVGGQFGYTTDIGGYVDLLDGPPDDELFTRWSEWSALTPFFRVHNSAYAGTRRPWDFAPATYERWLAVAALHQRAVPLIRRLWAQGRRTGVPPTRPLWLADPRSTEAQEWLLGSDVLVAPVVEQAATSRAVRFPAGCWQRPDGTGRVTGPASRTVAAPVGALPYFFRCGTRPF